MNYDINKMLSLIVLYTNIYYTIYAYENVIKLKKFNLISICQIPSGP